jgi:N utilization substance protein B
LAAAAENWRLPRMAAVDRNILRLGAYELLFTPATPSAVALNEAIELARRYGSADSPGFINGVLDRLRLAATSTE